MEITNYLIDWWNGTLQGYEFLGFQIFQLNKIIKSLQYITGFIALVEIVNFTNLFKNAKILSKTYLAYFFFIKRIYYLPYDLSFLLILIMYPFLFLLKRGKNKSQKKTFKNFKGSYCQAIRIYIKEKKIDSQREANDHILVWILDKLSSVKLSEKAIKQINFILFALLSLLEIFTS